MAVPVEQSADRKTAIATTSVTKPTNLANGDVIVIHAIYYDAVVASPTISGFTRRVSIAESTTNILNGYIFDRVVDGSEGSTFSIAGLSGGSGPDLIASRVTGAAGGFHVAGTPSHGNSNTPNLPAITTTVADCLVFGLHVGYDHGIGITGTNPSGYTALLGGAGNSAFDGVNDFYSQNKATAGTITSATYVLDDGAGNIAGAKGTDAWASITVAYTATVAAASIPPPKLYVPTAAVQRASSW